MAIAITKPNDATGKFIYCDLENTVTWTSTVNGTPTYFVSINSGSTWTEQTTQISNVGANSLDWTPAVALMSALNEIATAQFRIHDDDGDHDSDVFTLRRIPILNIRPNADNVKKIYKDDLVNIVWSELYSSNLNNVKIEIWDGSNWYDIIASTINSHSYVFKPSEIIESISASLTCHIKITGLDTSPYIQTAIIVEGTDFILTSDYGSITPDNIDPEDFIDPDHPLSNTLYDDSWKDAPNVEIHEGEMIGEKGSFMNAAMILAQIEAGHNMQIVQRRSTGVPMDVSMTIVARVSNYSDYVIGAIATVTGLTETLYIECMGTGTTKATLPVEFSALIGNPMITNDIGEIINDGTVTWRLIGNNYCLRKLAYNIIWRTKQTQRLPREFEQIITFNYATDEEADHGLYYGKLLKKTLTYPHSWTLGLSSDPLFIVGQTNGSFIAEINQITGDTDFTPPIDNIKAWHRIISGVYTGLDIYCVWIDPSKLTNPHDSGYPTATYKFLVRWHEIIPS